MENIDKSWPIWAVMTYLFIKDALPVLSTLVIKLAGVVVPAKVKERKMKMDQQLAAIDKQIELEEKRTDLREREVVALEQIGKSLVVIDTRLQGLDKKSDLITTGLVTANQALAIMMDRVHRRREDFSDASQTPLGSV